MPFGLNRKPIEKRKFHPRSFMSGMALGALIATGGYLGGRYQGKIEGRVEANRDAPVQIATSVKNIEKKTNATLDTIAQTAKRDGMLKVDDLLKFQAHMKEFESEVKKINERLPADHPLKEAMKIFLEENGKQ